MSHGLASLSPAPGKSPRPLVSLTHSPDCQDHAMCLHCHTPSPVPSRDGASSLDRRGSLSEPGRSPENGNNVAL